MMLLTGRINFQAGCWLLGAALLGAPAAHAQQVLLRAEVANDTLINRTGPNRRYFGHFYLGLGLAAGGSQGAAPVRYGFSAAEFQAGGRLKRRLTQTVAVVADLRYDYLRYGLAQNQGKAFPDAAQHLRERVGLHQMQAEAALRLNAGRRGNTVGSYLDLLAWGGWVASTSHTFDDDPAPGTTARTTTETGLAYLRRATGGVGARLGFDRYALAARYRLSPALRTGASPGVELPRWVLGVEIGLF